MPDAAMARLMARPASWVVLSAVCAAIDYATGPAIQFPVAYLLPIGLAAWYGSRDWGLALAAALALVRLAFLTVWTAPWGLAEASINAVIFIIVFAAFAWLVDRTATQIRGLERTQVLEGLLGVCTVCKRIHNERVGEWQPVDLYLASRPPQAQPDVCPRCMAHAHDVLDRR